MSCCSLLQRHAALAKNRMLAASLLPALKVTLHFVSCTVRQKPAYNTEMLTELKSACLSCSIYKLQQSVLPNIKALCQPQQPALTTKACNYLGKNF